MRSRQFAAMALAIVVLAVGAGSCARRVAPQAGQDAPEITLTELATGAPLTLPAGRAGQPYSVTFFSYGCGPCRQEVLQLQPIRTELEAKGFKIYVITDGNSSDIAFLQPMGFEVLLDPKRQAFDAYKVTGIPTAFFVNEGVIRKVSIGWGEGSLAEFRDTVNRLTGGS